MRSTRCWRLGALVLGLALVAFGVQSAVAGSRHAGQPPEQTPGSPAFGTVSGKNITAVKVVTAFGNITFSGTTYTDVPSMSTTISVPVGQTARLITRFSAETECTTSVSTAGWCGVRILVDGVEADPATGTDFAFSSTNNGTAVADTWASNALERVSQVLAEGSHTVKVQWRTTDPTITIWLGELNLTIERVKL